MRRDFFLGMGVALVVMSVLTYFVYSFQYVRLRDEFSDAAVMTEREIVRHAENLGMMFLTVDASVLSDDEIIDKALALGMVFAEVVSEPEMPEPAAVPETLAPTETLRRVVITPGMTAEAVASELKKAGVLPGENTFLEFLHEAGATRRLVAGEYYFRENCGYEEILKNISLR